jgi:hypothetical protein
LQTLHGPNHTTQSLAKHSNDASQLCLWKLHTIP